MALSKDAQFLLKDLIENKEQSSWDWEADLRFAEHLEKDTDLIIECINSCAPAAIRAAVAETAFKSITQRRLRGLRELVKAGKAYAFWSGTGAGGKTEFGVGRIKSYVLTTLICR